MERYSRVKNATFTCGTHGIGKEVARPCPQPVIAQSRRGARFLRLEQGSFA